MTGGFKDKLLSKLSPYLNRLGVAGGWFECLTVIVIIGLSTDDFHSILELSIVHVNCPNYIIEHEKYEQINVLTVSLKTVLCLKKLLKINY